MRSKVLGIASISALLAAWVACSSNKDDEPAPVLAVATFDVSENGWGDAPLPVHFVWSIQSNTGKSLTCKLDWDGDGTFDKTIEGCTADTMNEGLDNLPTYTFDKVGLHQPKLVVTDGERTVEATTKIFANKLEFSKTTIFPEKLPGFLSAEVTPMTKVVLEFVDATKAPDVKPGDIIWGTSGSGYLIKVTTATKSGGTVTINGTQAKITDAVENGFFGARDVQAPMDDVKCLSSECAGYSFEKLDPTTDPSLGTKTLGRSKSALTLKGQGSFGLKVPLPAEPGLKHSLFVGLAVKEFMLEISWFKLKKATLDIRPGFQYDFAIEKELLNKEFRLGTISLGVFPIGPFIVTPVILPTVRVGASLKLGGSVGLNLPFQVKYDGGWSSGMQPDMKNTAAELLDPNGSFAGASAEASFVPKVNLLLMGIAGPYAAPTGTLSVEGRVQTAPASDLAKCGFPYQLCFNAKVGAGGEYGAELPWIDGLTEKKEFQIAEFTLWEKCFGKPDEKGNCPPNPPNIDGGTTPIDGGGTTDGGKDADAGCPTDGGRSSDPACSKCEHDLCTDGTALSPTCSACAGKVCAADIYCCTEAWTLSCRRKANELCGAGCPE
jgi:hypothetical protein